VRDRSIFGEVFFVKIVFLEKRIDRTRFELIRRRSERGERFRMLVMVSRSACRKALFEERCWNGNKIREKV